MSAGAVHAPLIIPLRLPSSGASKSQIDSITRLELISDTPNVDIYFTINGSRPVIKKHERDLLNTGTFKFHTPFVLPPGIQTVRAVAYCSNTCRESNVVTKTFDVLKSKTPDLHGSTAVHDDYRFLEDLKNIEYHRRKKSNPNIRSESLRVIHRLLGEKNSLDDDLAAKENGINGQTNYVSEAPKTNRNKSGGQKQTGHKEEGNQRLQEQQLLKNSSGDSADADISHALDTSKHHLVRLQRATSVLSCPTCFQPRSTNTIQKFCTSCGHSLPKLPTPQWPSQVIPANLGSCQTCGSQVPLGLPNCLVCEGLHRPAKDTQANDFFNQQEFRLCPTCHAVNPFNVASCLTCEASLLTGRQNVIQPPFQYGSHLIDQQPSPNRQLSSSGSVSGHAACLHCRRENSPSARFCDWCGFQLPRIAHRLVTSPNLSSAVRKQHEFEQQTLKKNTGDFLSQQPYVTFLQCPICGQTRDETATFCCRCGNPLGPPPRQFDWLVNADPQALTDHVTTDSRHFHLDRSSNVRRTNTPLTRELTNAATQTVGIYYPSSACLRNQAQVGQARPNSGSAEGFQRQIRDRLPLMMTVSPGRGFWRKQLEHLVTHLKVYTSNNPSFRAAISEPRFGQLITADIRETATQAVIYLTYSLPKNAQQASTSRVPTSVGGRRSMGSKQFECEVSESQIVSSSSAHEVDVDAYDRKYGDDDDDDVTTSGDDSTLGRRRRSRQINGDKRTPRDGSLSSLVRLQPSSRPGSGLYTKPPSSGARSESRIRNLKNRPERRRTNALDSSRSSVSSTTISSSCPRPGKQRSRRKVLPGTRQGHFGEAGVALQREAKLSTIDRSLLRFLAKRPKVNEAGEEVKEEADEVTRLLVEGADPNCINADGETPLIVAVHSHRVSAIAVLVNNGAKVNSTASTLQGNTALHEAVLSSEDGIALVQALLKCGANPKLRNKQNQTPYSLASQMKCDPLIREFVSHWGEREIQKLTSETLCLASPSENELL